MVAKTVSSLYERVGQKGETARGLLDDGAAPKVVANNLGA
jgi:hypothetical protein